MLVNRDEIVCDECDARIEPRQKPGGWEDASTAEAHVCEGCWERKFFRAYMFAKGYTTVLKEITFPVRTFIGQVIEDDVVEKVMERFGVSQTT